MMPRQTTCLLASLVLLSLASTLAAQSNTPRADAARPRAPYAGATLGTRCLEPPAVVESPCSFTGKTVGSSAPFDRWFSVLQGADPSAVAVDKAGQIYLAGQTWNSLPVTPNAFQPVDVSGYFQITGFLLKLDPSGSQVLYGTYLNGLIPLQIVVDQAGYIYVFGFHPEPGPPDFFVSYPAQITSNAAQAYPGTAVTPTLLKIAPTGELVYATFLGGLVATPGGALAVDSRGSAVVCGSTGDPTLSTSPGAFQHVLGENYNVFVARLSPDGSAFQALTYLGGDGMDYCSGLQLDSDGNIYVFGDTTSEFFPVTPGAFQTTRGEGTELFAAKLDPSMEHLLWSTYIGGTYGTSSQPLTNGFPPGGQTLALTADGSLAFMGITQSYDYPMSPDTSPPAFPAGYHEPVFGVLDSTGSRLIYSSPISLVTGFVNSIVTGDGNTFFLVGSANIGEMAVDATLNAQGMDGLLKLGSIYDYPFLAEFNLSSRSLTYLGPLREINGLNRSPGIGSGVAPDGSLILASSLLDSYAGFGAPVRSIGGGDENQGYGTILFDLNLSDQKMPLVTALVNPASLLPSPLTPGQLIEVRGIGLGPELPGSPAVAPNPASPPSELAGTQLTIDGQAAPLLSVQDNSILALAPASVSSAGTSVIAVKTGDSMSDSRTVTTAALNPALFTLSGTGVGHAIAVNADGSPNSSAKPAIRGQSVRLFATGLGATTSVGGGAAVPNAKIAATVNGLPAPVTNVTPAQGGYPAGYFAIDIVVPLGAPETDFAVVAVSAGGTASQPGVTISIAGGGQ